MTHTPYRRRVVRECSPKQVSHLTRPLLKPNLLPQQSEPGPEHLQPSTPNLFLPGCLSPLGRIRLTPKQRGWRGAWSAQGTCWIREALGGLQSWAQHRGGSGEALLLRDSPRAASWRWFLGFGPSFLKWARELPHICLSAKSVSVWQCVSLARDGSAGGSGSGAGGWSIATMLCFGRLPSVQRRPCTLPPRLRFIPPRPSEPSAATAPQPRCQNLGGSRGCVAGVSRST